MIWRKLLFVSTLLFCIAFSIEAHAVVESKTTKPKLKTLVISKEDMTLKAYGMEGELVMQFPIATGLNYGQKASLGDKKTPEGIFTIVQVQDASKWSHDFKDGKGVIKHAYGNHFIRLAVPRFKSIGIHGTHAPESIGTRATEGCIRLHNAHLDSLVSHLDRKETIIILPGLEDVLVNNKVEIDTEKLRVQRFSKRIIQLVLHQELYTMLPQTKARLDVPCSTQSQHQKADVEHLTNQDN